MSGHEEKRIAGRTGVNWEIGLVLPGFYDCETYVSVVARKKGMNGVPGKAPLKNNHAVYTQPNEGRGYRVCALQNNFFFMGLKPWTYASQQQSHRSAARDVTRFRVSPVSESSPEVDTSVNPTGVDGRLE